MCNLSQGIFEKGQAIGEAKGRAIGEARIIFTMYKNGYTIEQIAKAADKTVEEVEAVIKNEDSVLV